MTARTSAALLLGLFAGSLHPSEGSQQPEDLIAKLGSDKVEERDEAARKLKALGKAALPVLEKATKDKDVEVAARAVRLIRVIGLLGILPPPLAQAMPGIEERLATEDQHQWTRTLLEAAETKDGRPRFPGLARRDLDFLAARALRGAQTADEKKSILLIAGRRGLVSAIPEVMAVLKDPENSGELHSIAPMILELLDATSTIPDLAGLLKNSDPRLLIPAVDALGRLQARDKIPDLLPLLQTSYVNAYAAEALGRLGAQEAVGRILEMLDSSNAFTQVKIFAALGYLKPKEAVPKLRELLKSTTPNTAALALGVLGEIGAKEAVPDIVACLHSPNLGISSRAAQALGRMKAAEAKGDLSKLLDDPNPIVCGMVLLPLKELGATESIPQIASLLTHQNGAIRSNAATALAGLGAKAKIPELTKLLGDPEPLVRAAGLDALADLGAKGTIQEVQALLRDKIPLVRSHAVEALADLGAASSTDEILKLVEDEDGVVRRSAMRTVVRFEEKRAIAVLAKLLSDPDIVVRHEAAATLCSLGSTEGIAFLISEMEDLSALNALLRPDVWKMLTQHRVVGRREGSNKTILDQLALDAGVSIEGPNPATAQFDAWLGDRRLLQNPRNRMFLIDALRAVLGKRYSFILESNRVRIMEQDEAFKFWKDWWSKEARK